MSFWGAKTKEGRFFKNQFSSKLKIFIINFLKMMNLKELRPNSKSSSIFEIIKINYHNTHYVLFRFFFFLKEFTSSCLQKYYSSQRDSILPSCSIIQIRVPILVLHYTVWFETLKLLKRIFLFQHRYWSELCNRQMSEINSFSTLLSEKLNICEFS